MFHIPNFEAAQNKNSDFVNEYDFVSALKHNSSSRKTTFSLLHWKPQQHLGLVRLSDMNFGSQLVFLLEKLFYFAFEFESPTSISKKAYFHQYKLEFN